MERVGVTIWNLVHYSGLVGNYVVRFLFHVDGYYYLSHSYASRPIFTLIMRKVSSEGFRGNHNYFLQLFMGVDKPG